MHRAPSTWPHGLSRCLAVCCLVLGFLTISSAADLTEEKIQHAGVNGMIWIESTTTTREARIAVTPDFVKRREGIRRLSSRWIQTAVQSGPMLLIDGKRHPAFSEGSPNRLRRNGVGVDSQNQLVFAITDTGQRVNFWDFAGLFLHLGCRNALFLDGNLSQMEVNPARGIDSFPLGAMFAVAE